jgi:16S rRNA (cytidine1402-2'-O)-methyltransferase
MPGTLFIVSTPIGNLKDMTFRAVEVLKEAAIIAAEDTRHTGILTSHYGIDTPLTSYFQYNKVKKSESLIRMLKEAKDVALVSDSGTPGISDPGFVIIKKALEEDIPVVPIPGPAGFLTALSVSGLPTTCGVFDGAERIRAPH